MNTFRTKPSRTQLIAALASNDSSMRLKAALAIGSNPEQGLVDILVSRCAIEPDFFVRDMLTWALIRFPAEVTVPKLLAELHCKCAQARSQALHTLSKIKDTSTWPAITRSLLHDSNDEVAQSAWRTAVVLVPSGQEKGLADELATQFGRGSRDMQLSLSLAIVALGEEAIESIIEAAIASDNPGVKAHGRTTLLLLHDSDSGFQYAVDQVKRIFAPT
ncbi:MAG: HEAT repeat domain-containing protein [Flavobacteriales bacterium]|nr:HEAT repeat domain-containing protein [Flavobacteriales bacterium]